MPRTSSSAADTKASVIAVLAAPWVAIVRPRRAGQIVRRAGVVSVIAGFVLVVAVLSAELVLLVTWDETCQPDYSAVPQFTISAQVHAATEPADRSPRDFLHLRSFGQVWADWERQGSISPVVWLPLLVAALAVGCHLYGTVCLLPRTYDGRPAKEAVKATLRVPWVCLGFVAVVMAVVGSAIVIGQDRSDLAWARHWASGGQSGPEDAWRPYVFAGVTAVAAASAWWIAAQARRIAAGAVPRTPPTEPHPRCCGCGYSLAHVPDDGRCPECGESADRSLSPQIRPGLDWQVRRFDPVANFVRTAFWILLRPSRAYAAMLTRGQGGRPWRFEAILFLLVTGATMVGIGLFVASQEWWSEYGGWEELCSVALLGLWIGFGAWAVHRGIGGAAVLVAAASGERADARALAGAVGYESVFVWGFFALDFGAAFGLYHGGDALIDRLQGLGFSANQATELIAMSVIAANVALGICWFLRYRIAYRAVRWANF